MQQSLLGAGGEIRVHVADYKNATAMRVTGAYVHAGCAVCSRWGSGCELNEYVIEQAHHKGQIV